MIKMTKHLRIRLSKELSNKLEQVLIFEQRSKSSLVRDALTEYIEGNYSKIENQNKK